ncbi:hypothetical protein BKA93DRAFT_45072 [Sparassis latifolia]
MDPTRRHTTDHPEPARRPASHSRNPSPPGNLGHPQVQPSLPSIHELSLRPQLPSPVPPYGHPPGTSYPVASGSNPGTRPVQEDSDPEDQQEPPRKKRRRQALSCTECKRRKIKCDRAQPCGPCARRGEHLKCQWHIIEPMEKYVTRTEYDELKSRVYELEALVSRMRTTAPSLPGRMAMSSPMIAMSPGSPADPIQGTMITPYHPGLTSAGSSAYHRMIPPTRSPPDRGESSSVRGEPSSRPAGSSAARSPPHRSSASYVSMSRPMPPAMPSTDPAHPSVSPERLSRAPQPTPSSEPVSSSVVTSRRASLSLAAITTPFIPDTKPQSPPKKYQAQTPSQPGQRLRPAPAYHGSAQAV